ncbi:MAG TPA: hypothetical protein VJ600_04050 [Holophagaceae bacterium]|nr:hypothetical protein [Holophagaceae bacterium]
MGCSSSIDVNSVQPPNSGDPAPSTSSTMAVFDPSTGQVPLPNILATATATDPLAGRAPASPMNPQEALNYVALHEMGGPAQGLPVGASTNAVSGLNAPIYLRFSAPVVPTSVTAATVKVFQIGIDANGVTENNPLTFTNISGMFSYKYIAGSTDLFLFPNFPLLPGTRYAYFVTNGVLDAATNKPITSSPYFGALKSTTSLVGTLFAALEPIRADVTNGPAILLKGYAHTMDDVIAAAATTQIASRANITLMGRFITTGAGYVRLDQSSGTPGTSLIPVESAIRAFAAGSALGGLPGVTWDNTATIPGNTLPAGPFTVFVKGTPVSPDLYYQAVTGGAVTTAPASVGLIALGSFHSADLSMDPVVVAANAGTMDLTGVTLGGAPAYDPAAGVIQPFRVGNNMVGYYHTDRTIPFLYIAPASAAPAGGYPLVIFQHGITRSKEDALALAQACTGQGRAILAIDLALHGQNAAPPHLIQPGDSPSVIAQKMAAWGADFMDPGTPLSTRTNIQESVFDLDRLEFVLRTGNLNIALAGAGVGTYGPNFTTLNPTYVGQSLGSIVGACYLAGNTVFASPGVPNAAASMRGFLSVPGGRTAYLIQASPAFGPTVDAGLAAAGIPKGSVIYNQFFLLTQTIVDPVDPATMTTPLVAGAPSRLSGRIAIQEATSTTFDASGNPTNGDLVITNPYTRYFGNALGGRGVLGAGYVAPNFMQLGYTAGGTPNHAAGVVGTPFMYTIGGSGLAPKVGAAAITAADTTPNEGYFQFDQPGISHGFLLDPSHPTNIYLGQKQMVYFLGVTGTSIVVDPTQTAPFLPTAGMGRYDMSVKVPTQPRTYAPMAFSFK